MELKDHRYINRDSDLLLTKSQEKRINDYIDDICIELFFKNYQLPPVLISPDICNYRYTPNGLQLVKEEFEINLGDSYDRYTFVKIICSLEFWRKAFGENEFVQALRTRSIKYNAYAETNRLEMRFLCNPCVDAYCENYGNLQYRARNVLQFHDYYLDEGFNYPPYFHIYEDIYNIKEENIFPNITVEYALALFSILAEKMEISKYGITPLVAACLNNINDCQHPFYLFNEFEMNIHSYFREELIDIRDCFLRFANAETSRAFFFRFDNPYTDYVTLKLFNEKPVISVVSNNTLPLPYLLTKLYNL